MKMEHNGIKFTHDFEKSIIECDTAENGVTTDKEFVILYTKLYDYLKCNKVQYFVLVKRNNDFELSYSYHKYRKNIFIDNLLRFGVEQIFYLVKADKKKKYRKVLPECVEVVGSYGEIEEVINKKCTTDVAH